LLLQQDLPLLFYFDRKPKKADDSFGLLIESSVLIETKLYDRLESYFSSDNISLWFESGLDVVPTTLGLVYGPTKKRLSKHPHFLPEVRYML
jgi:hypothetical protein